MEVKRYKNITKQVIIVIILFIFTLISIKMNYYAYKSLDSFGEKDYYNALTDSVGSTKALNIYAISWAIDKHSTYSSEGGKLETIYYLVAYKHFPELDTMSIDDILFTKAYPGEFEEYFTVLEINKEDKELLKILGRNDLSKNPYKVKVSVDDRPWIYNKIPTKYGVLKVELSNKYVSIDTQKSTYYVVPIMLVILVISLLMAIRKVFLIVKNNECFREKIYDKFPELEKDDRILETKSSYINEKLGIYIYKDYIIFTKGKYQFFYLEPEKLYPRKLKISITHKKSLISSTFNINYDGILKLIYETCGTTDSINIKIPFVFSSCYGDAVIDYLRKNYAYNKAKWIKNEKN